MCCKHVDFTCYSGEPVPRIGKPKDPNRYPKDLQQLRSVPTMRFYLHFCLQFLRKCKEGFYTASLDQLTSYPTAGSATVYISSCYNFPICSDKQ